MKHENYNAKPMENRKYIKNWECKNFGTTATAMTRAVAMARPRPRAARPRPGQHGHAQALPSAGRVAQAVGWPGRASPALARQSKACPSQARPALPWPGKARPGPARANAALGSLTPRSSAGLSGHAPWERGFWVWGGFPPTSPLLLWHHMSQK
jgi:hypothetical protein